MIGLLLRLPFYKLQRQVGYPRLLPVNFTVSVTYRCNSRCRTCRVYKKRAAEMDPKEYARIFASLGGAPYWVTISGGEPFLRRDLVEICGAIYQESQPAIINIPTNGILCRVIPQKVEEIARTCPRSKLIVNLSLDHYGRAHDELRMVEGNFEKAMESWQALKALKKQLPNLSLGIHTVISRFNVREFPGIYQQLIRLEPDSYITEVAEERVELGTVGSSITPQAEEYARAIDYLIGELKKASFQGVGRLTRAFRLEYYELVKRVLSQQRAQIPCYAGILSCQIAPQGDVWPCCITAEVMGNLRDYDYNFRRLWFSPKAQEIRRKIRTRRCFCPLANAAYTNMLANFRSLLRAAYWMWRLK